jgi:hypothetical protein
VKTEVEKDSQGFLLKSQYLMGAKRWLEMARGAFEPLYWLHLLMGSFVSKLSCCFLISLELLGLQQYQPFLSVDFERERDLERGF